MKTLFKVKKYSLVKALSVPVLLGLAACDSSTVSDINNALNSGGDVDINISTNDDGNIVISTQPGDDGNGAGAAVSTGGVLAMSKILDQNTIVAYDRAADGTCLL